QSAVFARALEFPTRAARKTVARRGILRPRVLAGARTRCHGAWRLAQGNRYVPGATASHALARGELTRGPRARTIISAVWFASADRLFNWTPRRPGEIARVFWP